MITLGGEELKTAKIVVSLLLVVLIFSGCSMRISSSIDELIAPISPFGDNADIKKAMDEYASKGYSLKTPSRGKYITAYNFFDVDGDGKDEAIAFYEPSDKLGTTDMAVIKKSDGGWKVIESIQGDGAEVSSLDFQDVNGDKSNELIVCWDTISNSTNHELAIYSYGGKDGKNSLKCIYSGITVNNYIAVDMTGGKTKELLLFELNSGNYTSAKAELYSFLGNRPKLLGETKLDAHITSYVDLQVEEIDGDKRVYADALGTNGSSMLTEIVYWSSGYGTIISPFYSYSSGVTSGTTRSIMLSSRDINGDGRIEIPHDKKLKGLPKSVICSDWRAYKKTILIHTDYSLSPKNDGYLVVIPDKYINEIKVEYDSENKIMKVLSKDDKREVFSVRPVLKAKYNNEKFSGYTVVLSEKGYYYLAKTGDSEKVKISIDDLKKYTKSISREEKI